MKRNSVLVLTKNEAMRMTPSWNYLEYGGIDNGNYTFFFDDCKISIPFERANQVGINKYQFVVEEASQESISLKYLGLKKKSRNRRNTYKG
jgi:hypothetical protein